MSYTRPHFVFEDTKSYSADFAHILIAEMGQATLQDCDVVISIGGDGMLLHNLATAQDKPVYAITPPGSNSNGFWTDHDVRSAQDLKAKLASATLLHMTPLKADIHFTNGNSTICRAFNDVAIERASGQSVLINLSAECNGQKIAGPYRILGDGFIFSTAMGSTGTNRSYQGPIADIRNDVMIMTGKGVYEPRGMVPMILNGTENITLHADFASVAHKRPVRIDYDGSFIERDKDGSPIDGLVVSADHSHTAKLLINIQPVAKTFSAMMG